MTYFLGDVIAEFARKKGSRDRKKRKPRILDRAKQVAIGAGAVGVPVGVFVGAVKTAEDREKRRHLKSIENRAKGVYYETRNALRSAGLDEAMSHNAANSAVEEFRYQSMGILDDPSSQRLFRIKGIRAGLVPFGVAAAGVTLALGARSLIKSRNRRLQKHQNRLKILARNS